MNKKKRKGAIALGYDEETNPAPKVVAKGKGLIAEDILQRAEENNIPIHEDAALVKILEKVNLNEDIPEPLFMAVAEVFAFIYQMDQRVKEGKH